LFVFAVFCRACEKVEVENTNKLVRQYIPKGFDISKYSEERIMKIEDKL